jgi:hypothetical protein
MEGTMGSTYDADVVAWANEQVALLRAGRLSDLDIDHIAEEIEDVGKSEQRELAGRISVLLVHLLKWECLPERRSSSWENTINIQRKRVERRINRTPSLRASLFDEEWRDDAWDEAVERAAAETGIEVMRFPSACPWNPVQIMDRNFFPSMQYSNTKFGL